MGEILTGVNGTILKWARERYNLSPEDAAHSIGITSERYVSWENGEAYPTYAMLKKISNVFQKPLYRFFSLFEQ